MTRTERLRLNKAWSQNRMAAYLGLSQAQVSRIETGVSDESGAVGRLLDMLEAEAPDAASSSPRDDETTGG